MKPNRNQTRRRFLRTTAALAGASIVPRWVLGGPGNIPPSNRLSVAIIGAGGQGITNLKELLKHPEVNISALCAVAEFWDNSHLYYKHHGGRGPAQQALQEHRRRNPDATPHWDGPNMTATNVPEAEPFVRGYFRKGWEI